MLRQGTKKNVTTLIEESIVAYKKTLLKDMNLKIRITLDDKTYLTKLAEWENDILILAAPLEQLDWVILPTNTRFEATFMTKVALYTTQLELITKLKRDGAIYYSCKIIAPFVRKQQREFFRLDTVLDTQYQLISRETESLPLNSPHYKGTILNISLGGLCLVGEHNLAAGTLIYMRFEFLETPLALVGEVLFQGEPTPAGTYSHRIRFVDLTTKDENTLNRLIMMKQRLMNKSSKTQPHEQ